MSLKVFFASGKLLLTAEYAVLDGALALALPTHQGQTLSVEETDEPHIYWQSIDEDDQVWFEAKFSLDFQLTSATDEEVGARLESLLQAAGRQALAKGANVTARLEFPRIWGLGSSSTLVSLVAQWLEVEPFALCEATFGGSAYDVACATAEGPILYNRVPAEAGGWELPSIKPQPQFRPVFSSLLYFVHLGKKQDSRKGIAMYRHLDEFSRNAMVRELSIITRAMLDPELTFNDMEKLIQIHEDIVARSLQLRKAKELHFQGFWGQVKSLGAWGGDFVLVTSQRSSEETREYFRKKGFETFVAYDDMVL